MLSISETIDGVLQRLNRDKKAFRDLGVVQRSEKHVVIATSCYEMNRSCLGRLLVTKIKRLNYKNRPARIGFTIRGLEFNINCDETEVLVYLDWRTNEEIQLARQQST